MIAKPLSARIAPVAAFFSALLLAACQTPAGPVEVTRFHRIAEGVAVAPAPATVTAAPDSSPAQTIEQRIYEAAVTTQLQKLGYAIPPAGPAAVRAEVRVTRSLVEAADNRGPVSVGVGGSTGSYGSGVGMGLGINLGGGTRPTVVTRLEVRLIRLSDDLTVWEGRAIHRAKQGSPADQPGLAAPGVAAALFRDFPGQSGAAVLVQQEDAR